MTMRSWRGARRSDYGTLTRGPDQTGRHYLRWSGKGRTGGRGSWRVGRNSIEHLREECRRVAKSIPPGDSRTTLLDMAEEWERLAQQQSHATDLRKEGR
jgi:hypothetical protein